MTRVITIIGIILVALLVVGSGLSKEQIAETVKSSMQEKFDSDNQYKGLHLTVTNVRVLSKGGNQYEGIAKITYAGTSHDVPVQITADGKDVMWQLAPGGLSFIVQMYMGNGMDKLDLAEKLNRECKNAFVACTAYTIDHPNDTNITLEEVKIAGYDQTAGVITEFRSVSDNNGTVNGTIICSGPSDWGVTPAVINVNDGSLTPSESR